MKTLALVIVLTVFSFSVGLPPQRRFGFNDDIGYRASSGVGGIGPRFGVGGRGLGDHADWCPLRARDALQPLKRLPSLSRIQGPGYFNNVHDDDPAPRYSRSHHDRSNLRQIDDLNDADPADMDEGGVDIGGELWPRPAPPKSVQTNNIPNHNRDDHCNHNKAASFAKDATAAAASAAMSAAAAARAAVRATAAATCNPESFPDDGEDDTESDEENDENPDSPLENKVVYANNIIENDNPREESNSRKSRTNFHDDMNFEDTRGSGGNSRNRGSYQDTVGSDVKFHGNKKYQDTTDSGGNHWDRVSYQDTVGSDVNFESNKNYEDTTGSGGNSRSGGSYQDTVGSDVNSESNKNYEDTTGSGGNSRSRGSYQDTVGSDVNFQSNNNYRDTAGSGGNSRRRGSYLGIVGSRVNFQDSGNRQDIVDEGVDFDERDQETRGGNTQDCESYQDTMGKGVHLRDSANRRDIEDGGADFDGIYRETNGSGANSQGSVNYQFTMGDGGYSQRGGNYQDTTNSGVNSNYKGDTNIHPGDSIGDKMKSGNSHPTAGSLTYPEKNPESDAEKVNPESVIDSWGSNNGVKSQDSVSGQDSQGALDDLAKPKIIVGFLDTTETAVNPTGTANNVPSPQGSRKANSPGDVNRGVSVKGSADGEKHPQTTVNSQKSGVKSQELVNSTINSTDDRISREEVNISEKANKNLTSIKPK